MLTITILLLAIIPYAISTKLTTPLYIINSDKLNINKSLDKDSLTIALITDLHSCFYGDGQQEIMEEIYAKKPDIILLGGDIYDDKLPEDNTDILLNQLGKYMKGRHIYYVNGNHEMYLKPDIYHKIEQRITGYGIEILHGKEAVIDGTNIHIYGVADPKSGYFKKHLKMVGEMANPLYFNILLTHRPEYIQEYLHYPFHLIVAGHAHGGQWRIPYLINGIIGNNLSLFPKYAGGEYHFTTTQNTDKIATSFIVSRGLARESTRYIPRIFNRPELVFIKLTPQQN